MSDKTVTGLWRTDMPDILTVENPPDSADLDSSLPPVVSDQARELQNLKTQLLEAERNAVRAQKAASDYREQLIEAQADMACMKARFYAAEKARNAVSSQREAGSSAASKQLLRAEKELERAQLSAQSDLERAANRIQVLEAKLAEALASAAHAQYSQIRYRKRSSIYLTAGVSVGVLFCGMFLYRLLPHRSGEDAPAEMASGAPSEAPVFPAKATGPAVNLNVNTLSTKPFISKSVTKSLPDALDRLNRALSGFPGLDQEAVLHQVQKRQSTPGHSICSFNWSNGQPSIVFGRGGEGQSAETWALDISRCADAVEQAH
jgi:hypothetical protein